MERQPPAKPESRSDLMYRLAVRTLFVGAGCVVLAAGVILAALIYIGATIGWDEDPEPSQISFDADIWRVSEGDVVRFRMHRDLLETHDLTGRSMGEVVDLLGPGCRDCFGENSLAYGLGWYSRSSGETWLIFQLDENRRVIGHQREPSGRRAD